MHLFDVIAITFIILFIVLGIKRGFIAEIFHLAAMVGGVIGAYLFYPLALPYTTFLKISDQTKTIILFILSYIFIALAILMVGWVIKKIIHLVLFGWIDKIFGGLIGALKATVIIWIFIFSITLLPPSEIRNSFSTSQTFNFFEKYPIDLSPKHPTHIHKTKNKNLNKIFSYLEGIPETVETVKSRITCVIKSLTAPGS